jgi:hypothetical protein
MLIKKFWERRQLHIIYRHVAASAVSAPRKDRPDWFTHENCFSNLMHTLALSNPSNLSVNLHVLFDGDQKGYEADFIRKYVDIMRQSSPENVRRWHLEIFKGGSQALAMQYALNYIERCHFSDNDYIYLLENDYLHQNNWVVELNDLLESQIPFDYISLYDHHDKYPFHKGFHEMHHHLTAKLFVTKGRHWRTTPSACATFITSMKTFRADRAILGSGLMDHLMFDELAKRGRVVVSPIPSLSTHCMTRFLAPCINWSDAIGK